MFNDVDACLKEHMYELSLSLFFTFASYPAIYLAPFFKKIILCYFSVTEEKHIIICIAITLLVASALAVQHVCSVGKFVLGGPVQNEMGCLLPEK